MKKIMFCLLTIILFTSCNCPNCGRYPCVCDCEYTNGNPYNRSTSGGSTSDYFSAATLVGEWQISLDGYSNEESYLKDFVVTTNQGTIGIIPKDIVFGEMPVGGFGRCTITYSIGGRNGDSQWYQMDLYYNYFRRELTFYKSKTEKQFALTYDSFLFPTLTLRGYWGLYKWNKVRVTTPN